MLEQIAMIELALISVGVMESMVSALRRFVRFKNLPGSRVVNAKDRSVESDGRSFAFDRES